MPGLPHPPVVGAPAPLAFPAGPLKDRAVFFALKHAAGIALLGSLFYATGALAEVAFRRIEIPALGRFVVRSTLGLIAWTYLLFLFAAVGGLRAPLVLPVAAAVLVAAVGRGLRGAKTGASTWLDERRRAGLPWRALARALAVGLLPGLILIAIFFHDLSPNIGWDDNVYHLTLPKLYLAHGGFRRIPFNVYSNWPQNVELLFGLALMVQDYVLAKLVHAYLLFLVVVTVFRICRWQTSRGLAVLATLLVLANQVLLFEAERAYIDIGFAFFFLVAIACAVEHLRSQTRSPLILSGLSCGALAGTKLSGIAGLGCVLLIVLCQRPLRFDKERIRLILSSLLLPTVALAVPWLVKSALYTGNPVYPLFYRQLGGVEWNATLGQQFMAWQQSMGMGRSLHDYLALPARVILDVGPGYGHFDGYIGRFWVVLVPLSILTAAFARSMRPYLLSAGAYFVFWALSSQQMRFLIAVLPPLAIAATLALGWIRDKLPRRAACIGFYAVVLAGACWALPPILLSSSRRAFAEAENLLRHGPVDRSAVVPDGYAFINANTPPSSKIMLLNVNHGFFLDREYIADSFFEASQMNSVLSAASSEDDLAARLAGLNLTHLYLSRRSWNIPYPDFLLRFLQNPQHARLAYRCQRGDCLVYQLGPEAGAPAASSG